MVDRRGRAASPRRCARNPDLHLIAVVPRYPDQDGAVLAAAQPGRPASRRSRAARGRPATGSPSTASRTTRARRSTCTPRSASSTTSGPRSARDNLNRRSWTHDSRAVLRGARRRPATSASPRIPAGSATAPGSSPATCGCDWRASTSTAPTARRRRPARPGRRVRRRSPRRRDALQRVARRRPAGPAAARPAAPAPPERLPWLHPALGAPGSTGWSTTPTAGRCTPGGRAPGEPPARSARRTRAGWVRWLTSPGAAGNTGSVRPDRRTRYAARRSPRR